MLTPNWDIALVSKLFKSRETAHPHAEQLTYTDQTDVFEWPKVQWNIVVWSWTITWIVPTVQSYPDPVAGAPRSFIHRVSELSSLEGDTVRQEKLKKMRKSRKPPSWQSASSQSPRSRIKTLETVPTTAEQSKTSMAPCSFQWLALIACLSTLILFSCLTWLIFTFWDSWPGLRFFVHFYLQQQQQQQKIL